MKQSNAAFPRKVALGFRSGLEETLSDFLKMTGIPFEYETRKISYTTPASNHKYTPDFILKDTGVIVETKGIFTLADRKKHLLIQSQHPELDIRFVFSNSKNRLRKGSKTTYADWCNQHGFIFADKLIPLEWGKKENEQNN